MWQRYHLGDALLALGDGIVLAAAVVALGLVAVRAGRPLVRTVAGVVTARWLALAGVLGAVLGSAGSPRATPWLVAAAAALLVADEPTRGHPFGRWTSMLAVVSLAGIWSAVPDTEPPLLVTMVLLPSALWWARTDRAPGRAGTAALVVAGAGAAWVGSAGWGAALATVVAMAGIAVVPLVVGFGRPLVGRALLVVTGAHLVVALVVPRSIMRREVPLAVGIAVLVAVALAGVTALAARPRPRTGRE